MDVGLKTEGFWKSETLTGLKVRSVQYFYPFVMRLPSPDRVQLRAVCVSSHNWNLEQRNKLPPTILKRVVRPLTGGRSAGPRPLENELAYWKFRISLTKSNSLMEYQQKKDIPSTVFYILVPSTLLSIRLLVPSTNTISNPVPPTKSWL